MDTYGFLLSVMITMLAYREQSTLQAEGSLIHDNCVVLRGYATRFFLL